MPYTGDELVAAITSDSVDPEGEKIVYTYEWRKNGTAEGSGPMLAASQTKKNETWTLKVTPSDGKLLGPVAQASVTIQNSVPVLKSIFFPATAVYTNDDLVVTASAADADKDPVNLVYSWTKDGVATNHATKQIPASDTNRGERWKVTVTPKDTESSGTSMSAEIRVSNATPVLDSVSLSPLLPKIGDELVATPGMASDLDGDPITFSYQWLVAGQVASGQTGPTLPAGTASKGQVVQVIVTPSDNMDPGLAVSSSTVSIQNSAPSITGATISLSSGNVATETSTLSCDGTGWVDADGDSESYQYQWFVNSNQVSVAPTLNGAQFNKNDAVYCIATPFDGTETGPAQTAATVTIANSLPVIGSITLRPSSPTKGDILSVQITGWFDADGDTPEYRYQWWANDYPRVTSATFSGADFSRGDVVRATVTPYDGEAEGMAVSTSTVVILNSAPVMVAIDINQGSYTSSEDIDANPYATDLDSDSIMYTYEWTKNTSTVIIGNTARLDHTQTARGDIVFLRVTPFDGIDTGTPMTSNGINILNSPPTAPSVQVTPDVPTTNNDLVCSIYVPSSDEDQDLITYTYGWTRNGVATVFTSSVVSSSTTSAGELWRCSVTPNDGAVDGPEGWWEVTTTTACADSRFTGANCDQCRTPGGSLNTTACPTWTRSTVNNLYFTQSEVTVEQFAACVAAGVCPSTSYLTNADYTFCNYASTRSNHPMNCVNWDGATEYCSWMGGRLPSTTEWYAEASNNGTRTYPWGNTPQASCSHCVMDNGNTPGCGLDSTWPVCSKTAGNSVSGLCDMAGNVWEWTDTQVGTNREIRGGSWRDSAASGHLATDIQYDEAPEIRYSDFDYGIRCVGLSVP